METLLALTRSREAILVNAAARTRLSTSDSKSGCAIEESRNVASFTCKEEEPAVLCGLDGSWLHYKHNIRSAGIRLETRSRTARRDPMNCRVMIRLVGPGGSGKTTVGATLALRLGIPLLDLDGLFKARLGDISRYLRDHGYRIYASRNVEIYLDTLRSQHPGAVFSLSSGFLTYDNPHPDYHRILAEVTVSARARSVARRRAKRR